MSDHPPVRLGYHGSPRLVGRFLAAAGVPGDAVQLSVYDIADPFRALRAGELDLMMAKFDLREPDLQTSGVIGWDDRAVVLADHHPLAGRASVSIEELADCDVFAPPGVLPEYVWDQVVPRRTPAGRPLHRAHRARTVPQMMAAVRSGAVHVSLLSLADVAPDGVTVVPLHDLPPAPVTLAWRRVPALPEAARILVARAEMAAVSA